MKLKKGSKAAIAWGEKMRSMRGSRHKSSKRKRTGRGIKPLASSRNSRKKVSTQARSMAKKKSKYRRAKRTFTREIGTIGYAVAEPMIDGVIQKFAGQLALPADVGQVVAGYFLKKQRGILGDVGKAMYTINLYQLAKRKIAPMIGGIGGGVVAPEPNSGVCLIE